MFSRDNSKYTDFPQTNRADRKQTSTNRKQIRKTKNKQDETGTRQKEPCQHKNIQTKQEQY